MKYAARTSTLILAGFLAMTFTCGRAGGQSGGHGGFGGHGSGGHGGHASWGSSSGHSSGHSIGHSIGHSFAHIFGHHGLLDRQPRNRFVSGRGRAFGFGGCPYGWIEHDFSFGGNWNCSNYGYFFDPFFSGWFSGPLPYDPAFGGPTWFEGRTAPDSTVQSPAEPKRAYPPTIPDLTNETPNSSGSTTSSPNGMRAERPITLLQLVDGSMYGLTDYWVKDGELHYTTTYGGQNSLPLERIDFEKTVQLNADRGVPFVVRPQSVGR